MSAWTLGVIGGSGLYDIPGLHGAWRTVETPWGEPSDQLFDAVLPTPRGDQRIVFLPRHGRGHRIAPADINHRANIDALKRLGVTDVLSVSAVGSLREDLPPGSFVAVDQYVDRALPRQKSFFGTGCVAHVSLARPICPRLSGLAAEAARAAGANPRESGTYLVIDGPQFSTRAESEWYRAMGCAVIGMTNMPEARLAREAELPYASMAMVTDYDCWHDDHAAVEVANILEVMHANSARAKAMVAHLGAALAGLPRPPSPIDTCLDFALITAPEARDPALLARLDAVAGRVLRAGPTG
jgi:5'-methylthioadenosine phosphorylase